MKIYEQVYDALDNATYENGYEHECGLFLLDTVLQIHARSGIDVFNPNDLGYLLEGKKTVFSLRRET